MVCVQCVISQSFPGPPLGPPSSVTVPRSGEGDPPPFTGFAVLFLALLGLLWDGTDLWPLPVYVAKPLPDFACPFSFFTFYQLPSVQPS